MGMTSYDYYVMTGKKQLQAVEAYHAQSAKRRRELNKLKKAYGIEHLGENRFGEETTLQAVIFKDDVKPDEKIWRKLEDRMLGRPTYWIRKNTVEGKAVLRQFEPWIKFDAKNVAESVGYKWLFARNSMWPFNFGLDMKKKVFYFLVPVLPEGTETKEEWYTPVSGVKKIKYASLVEKLGRKP